jgi:hypothetical protein
MNQEQLRNGIKNNSEVGLRKGEEESRRMKK